ncbi:hypothetical protein B7494_g7039 [Chlorociboria aeruginascens]|nr:hypothetical protein B7494_g7039 [Chlorociboria aeruginascens]
MDQLRSLDATNGRAITDVLIPTIRIFSPLLLKNKSSILSIPKTTQSYGAHPRQTLDIYHSNNSSSILIFFYGGGGTRGDKIVDAVPEGLLYHNLGTFFAKRGITTIIPDYRRVNSEVGGEDAVFPSGGEDVSLVLQWLEGFEEERKKNVFLMGNSAGGVHVGTFMFAERFYAHTQELAEGKKGIVLKGVVQLSVPFHFHSAPPAREHMLLNYYGSLEKARENCVLGLLRKIQEGKDAGVVPDTLVLLGEFDPEDEIVEPTHQFLELWEELWGEGLTLEKIKGHNHISPTAGLESGDVEAERWGEDVVKWIRETELKDVFI